MEHGKNVRGPSLEKGVHYVMKTWGKVPVYNPVVFEGFVSGGQAYKVPTKQLKDMVPTDYYKFTGEEGEFRGKMKDNCLVHLNTEARITFFHLAGVSSDAVTVNADKPAKAPKAPKAAKQAEPKTEEPKIEQPAAEEPKAAKSDDAKERKRAADNERKRQKRAAEKAAKEAAKSSPAATEQPAEEQTEQTEQPEQTVAEHVESSEEQTETSEEPVVASTEQTVDGESEGETDATDDMPVHTASENVAPAAIA